MLMKRHLQPFGKRLSYSVPPRIFGPRPAHTRLPGQFTITCVGTISRPRSLDGRSACFAGLEIVLDRPEVSFILELCLASKAEKWLRFDTWIGRRYFFARSEIIGHALWLRSQKGSYIDTWAD